MSFLAIFEKKLNYIRLNKSQRRMNVFYQPIDYINILYILSSCKILPQKD